MNISVGTDIESVQRFKLLIESKQNLLKKIFFKKEFIYAISKVNPEQSFAGIWCAKEAVVKSFDEFKVLNIKNIEIICRKNCAPKVSIKNFSMKPYNYNLSLSISHTKDFATAVAILKIENEK